MRTLQIILLMLSSFAGYAQQADTVNTPTVNNTSTENIKTMANPDTLTYLALGDSYTIGEAVEQGQSYPYQLVNLLNNNFLSGKKPFKTQMPTIIATTGWTTDELINAIDQNNISGKKFSFVTLLIGVNDQYRHMSLSNYQVKFAQVLQTAINCANGDISRVFVISIPDYGVTPFAAGMENIIGPEIDAFNAINLAESKKAGVNYLNITDISKQAATNLNLVAHDGLHPSALMYKLWVQQLAPIVESKLKN